MFRHTSPWLLACFLSLGAASLVLAQTGPTGPGGPGGPAAGQPAAGTLTEQSLLEAMRALGGNPQEQKGPKGNYWSFPYQKDGWRYQVEVHPIKDQQGKMTGYYLMCPLNQLPSNIQAKQLLAILQGNLNTAPCFLAHRISDNRLIMVLENPFSTGITSQFFQGNLNFLLTHVKNSYSAWNLSPTLAQK